VRSHDTWLRGAHPSSGNRSDSRVRSSPSVSSSGAGSGPERSLRPIVASTEPTDTPGQALPKSGLFRPRVSPPEPVGGPLVGTACLEVGAVPLHQQIVAFSRRARAAGAQRVRLVPLFLLAGVHVMEDIPAEVEQARQGLPDLTLEVCPTWAATPASMGYCAIICGRLPPKCRCCCPTVAADRGATTRSAP
jgi:sirohydrochlorin cobaltochelatase